MVDAFVIICLVLFALVMLCFLSLGVIRIIDDIQDIQRKKIEWYREDLIRGWRKDDVQSI